MGNRNSSSSNSKVYGKATKIASTEQQYVQKQGKSSASGMVVWQTQQDHGTKASAFRDEHRDIAISNPLPLRGQLLDNDDTFNDYIRRAKKKIRSTTMSNNVWEQNNVAPLPAPYEEDNGSSSSKEENEKEQFSNFIQATRKKLRTTSSIRKNSSFRRGERT